jgi:hypothetical protein
VVLGGEPLVIGARRIWIEVDVHALDQVRIIDGERRAKAAAWGLAAAPRNTVLTDAFASASTTTRRSDSIKMKLPWWWTVRRRIARIPATIWRNSSTP